MSVHSARSALDDRIARLRQLAHADTRLEGVLLYGSWTVGEADAHSDIEAYLYIQEGHRGLTPGGSLGLVLLKSPDRSAALQLRYDRIDYPIRKHRAEMFAAIRRRISALTGEASLPVMPGCSGTG